MKMSWKLRKKALLNNLEDEKSLVDKLKFEEESQVMAIENILVKIDTFTFPMEFVTWGHQRGSTKFSNIKKTTSFLKPSMD